MLLGLHSDETSRTIERQVLHLYVMLRTMSDKLGMSTKNQKHLKMTGLAFLKEKLGACGKATGT